MKKEKEKIKYVEITEEDKIKFEPKTEEWGRAEFNFCPIFKRGLLKDLFIHRNQQENNECYHLKCNNQKKFNITTWEFKGYDTPIIWRNYWCNEHKTISFDVYVPIQCHILSFEQLSSLQIIFENDEDI